MADGDPYSGSMFTGTSPIVSPEFTSRNTTASTIHVFTREGRHLAGEALTRNPDADDQRQRVLADAQYDSTYLNGGTSYLDTGVVRYASATEAMIQSSVSGHSGTFDFTRLSDVDGAVSSTDGAMAHAKVRLLHTEYRGLYKDGYGITSVQTAPAKMSPRR